MGIFDYVFGSGFTPHKRQVSFPPDGKLKRQDIIDLAWSINSLLPKQKEMIKEYFIKEMDNNGVTKWEYKLALRRLWEKRVEMGLSETDYQNLKKIL